MRTLKTTIVEQACAFDLPDRFRFDLAWKPQAAVIALAEGGRPDDGAPRHLRSWEAASHPGSTTEVGARS